MSRKFLTNEAIAAALIEHGSTKAAAEALGCKRNTIYERRRDPDFQKIYAQAKADVLKAATSKIQGQMLGAVDTLVSIMKDEDTAAQTRTNAACYVLQYGVKLTETTDILDRIETLEESVNDD